MLFCDECGLETPRYETKVAVEAKEAMARKEEKDRKVKKRKERKERKERKREEEQDREERKRKEEEDREERKRKEEEDREARVAMQSVRIAEIKAKYNVELLRAETCQVRCGVRC